MLSGELNQSSNVLVTMVLSNGREVVAEDSGEVLRDALSEFWITFRNKCTLGCDVRVPAIRHDMHREHWEAAAKVLVMGYKLTSYMPTYLAPPFLCACLGMDDNHMKMHDELVPNFCHSYHHQTKKYCKRLSTNSQM